MSEPGGWLASGPAGLEQDETAGGKKIAPRPGLSPAAIVFAGLVVATIGAFFVTTRLKRSAPVVQTMTYDRHFSPNGDGVQDSVTFPLRLRRTDDATVSIVTRDGSLVRTLVEDLTLHRNSRYRFRWDGRTSAGRIAPDGEYRVRVSLRRQGRVVVSPRKIFVKTVPPNPKVTSVQPEIITPGSHGRARRATIHYNGPQQSPVLLVYRTDLAKPRLVARRPSQSATGVLHWDGRVGLGATHRSAPAGSYLFAVRVRDAAGNLGPAVLPPLRGSVRGRPGITVRYLAAEGPDGAVQGGAAFSVRIFSAGKRYRWRIHWLGSPHDFARGASRSALLRVRAPRTASGVAVLELRAGSHAYETPIAVQGPKRRRVLVVLPTVTWQAENPVEDNGDGYPDVLPLSRSVSLHRPIAGHGRPPGFATTAALLTQLRGAHRHYDINTDLAVARDGEAGLRGYTGVLVAGSPRFAPPALTRSLGSYVQSGGRVGWVGTRGFSRAVEITSDAIVGGPHSTFLGERVRVESGPRALVVLGDRIDFFRAINGAFGPFPRLEPSVKLPAGAHLIASAGAEPRRPDVIVYRFGRGVVARIGIDGVASVLAAGDGYSSVGRIMPRLWALLSR